MMSLPSRRARRSLAPAAALLIGLMVAAGPNPAAGQPTPYDPDLLRLAEILGALSHLDRLCGSLEPDVWRSRMEALITAQRMDADDRRRYVDVFNRGHRTFASVHRTCTDQTRFVLANYFEEGARIVARLDERFGRGTQSLGLPSN
jgi:uncharacterized protein (TIGR02301 family)